MKAGFDPNYCNPRSKRPLLSIAAMSDERLSVEAVDLLLEIGANIDLGCSYIASLKHSIGGLEDSDVPSLLNSSRNITKVLDERRLRGVNLLLEKGANPLAVDKNAESLLVLAAFEGFHPMVKSFLHFFDRHQLPFHQTKSIIWRAASTSHRDTAQCLSNYYWRQIYHTQANKNYLPS
jgi:ankyrin repeat protein